MIEWVIPFIMNFPTSLFLFNQSIKGYLECLFLYAFMHALENLSGQPLRFIYFLDLTSYNIENILTPNEKRHLSKVCIFIFLIKLVYAEGLQRGLVPHVPMHIKYKARKKTLWCVAMWLFIINKIVFIFIELGGLRDERDTQCVNMINP